MRFAFRLATLVYLSCTGLSLSAAPDELQVYGLNELGEASRRCWQATAGCCRLARSGIRFFGVDRLVGLASPTPIKDVGVDHGGAHVGVAEQFLHGANIVVALQQMRRERMAQRVRGGRFGDAPSYLLAMTFADNR